jgi:hypothetical protein
MDDLGIPPFMETIGNLMKPPYGINPQTVFVAVLPPADLVVLLPPGERPPTPPATLPTLRHFRKMEAGSSVRRFSMVFHSFPLLYTCYPILHLEIWADLKDSYSILMVKVIRCYKYQVKVL